MVVFSLSILIEAIIGTIIITEILLQLHQIFNEKTGHIRDTIIYLTALCLTSLYVISKELKFHNLGGNNVYDPYDVMASIIGLIMTFVIIQVFGFVDKLETNK